MLSSYIPVLIMIVVSVGFGVGLFVAAKGLGPYRPNPEKQLPYESGKDQASTPRIKFDVKFYRIALLFLVFDIEAAFLYPWAVMFKDLSCKGQLKDGVCHGSATPLGFLVMVVFLAILILALLFVWRKRALEWD